MVIKDREQMLNMSESQNTTGIKKICQKIWVNSH